jgi:hypothetical protein
MKFRSWHGPLHPELAEEMKRKKKKEKELHPCIVTLTWQAGNQDFPLDSKCSLQEILGC